MFSGLRFGVGGSRGCLKVKVEEAQTGIWIVWVPGAPLGMKREPWVSSVLDMHEFVFDNLTLNPSTCNKNGD